MSYIGFGIVHDDQPFVVDEFTGDNLTTQFVLSYPKPINGRSLIVTVGGSVIDDGIGADEFFVNGTGDVEFNTPPATSAKIRVKHLGFKTSYFDTVLRLVDDSMIVPGDFAFDGDTLFVDSVNDRIGINTLTPTYTLDVTGTVRATSGFIGNVTGEVSTLSNHTTDDLSEGTTNIYYTDTRARAAISEASAQLAYNATTGELTFTQGDTDTVSEGTTNLYYTDERVDDRVSSLIIAGTNISSTYDDVENTLTVAVDNTGGFNLANNDTDDLSEGITNLYYANALVDAHLSGGTGVTYNAGLISIGQDVATTADVTFNSATVTTNVAAESVDTDWIDFTQLVQGVVTGAVGRLTWNDLDGTLDLGLKGGSSTLQIGQEIVVRATNNSGIAIPNGSVVYISGALGNRLTVGLADSTVEAQAAATIGLATESIADNQQGYVTTHGLVRDIDTSAWPEGTILYLNGVVGGLTSTEPSPPAHYIKVGYVVRSHAVNGSIFVKVHYGAHLHALSDTNFSSIADNDFIYYESSTGTWKNDGLIGGTGVTYVPSTKTFSIGQDVATTADVTFNSLSTGDLTVTGTTTIINTTQLNVGDAIITLNADFAPATIEPTENAGFEIERGTLQPTVSFLWDETANKWTVGTETLVAATFEGNVTGEVSTLSNHTTDGLSEGTTNLYFTDARVDARISGGTGVTYNAGLISIGQSVETTDDLTFATVSATTWASTEPTLAPFTVASTAKVTNLNSDLLDGQTGSWYQDWTNTTNKPDPVITLAGDATGSVTLTDLGSGTLTVAVADDSHLHSWNNLTDQPGMTSFFADVLSTSVNQTIFTIPGGYTAGNVLVYLNGVMLSETTDFVASNGTTVVLTTGVLEIGEVLRVIVFGTFGIPTSNDPAVLITSLKTIDGAGSGLDSDLLDGQDGVWYQDWTNTTNKPTTDGIVEGITNLYYTDTRARAAISEASTQLAYNATTGVLTFTQGNTDTVTEGSTNLYYTNERVDDRVSSLIVAGTGLTATYDDVGNSLTIDLDDTAVTAASYGSASAVPVITIDAQGRITAASTTAIAGISSVGYVSTTGVFTITTSDASTHTADFGVGSDDSPTFANVTSSGYVKVGTSAQLETTIATVATTTQTVLLTFPIASFGSAKFIVTAHDTVTGHRHIVEILIAHNGTTAFGTEYGEVYTGTVLASYAVDILTGNLRFLTTGASANSTEYTIVKTLLNA